MFQLCVTEEKRGTFLEEVFISQKLRFELWQKGSQPNSGTLISGVDDQVKYCPHVEKVSGQLAMTAPKYANVSDQR